MKTFGFYFALLALFTYCCELSAQSSAQLVSTESDPDAFVENCVNVINGDYCESATDLIIEGPDRLLLQRFYNSTDYITGKQAGGWRILPERFLVLGKDPQGKSCRVGRDHFTWSYAFTGERSGGILPYCGWRKSDGITKDALQIDILNDGLGIVNTYAKEINGQNNHQNNVLHCNENSCELVLGDGTKRRYQRVQKLPSNILGEELIPLLAEKITEPEYFLLIQETLPSGSHLFFSYDSEGHLTSVEMKNYKQDKILSWIHFVYEFQESACFVKVETSDEKVLEYHFKQAHETYQLSEVKGSRKNHLSRWLF